ncbi:ComF family protein [Bacillus sp. Marseille-P3661]|uniref:ComF family protein n=1 Tax=Bacillus sp. Marseille-P3661 TaxID=1936234 RepID=UPI000C83C352|nr:ComF family protein [Bacillus sp. Marseille-P3661]
MYCLICHQIIALKPSWTQFLHISLPNSVCIICNEKFELINEEHCNLCSRPFSKLEERYKIGNTCNDCLRWEQDPEYKGLLTKNTSIYYYNDFLKELIARFKFRGDHELVNVFKSFLQEKFKQTFSSKAKLLIIPIPLSDQRLYERGFNQAHSIAALLGSPITEILSRNHSEKQSKKTRSQRLHSSALFSIKNMQDIPQYHNKTIVLIDDVYTTGTTIRKAAQALQPLNPQSVYSLTIARS